MDLKEIMKQKTFAVLGNTINEDKYAYKIKHALLDNNYKVFGVGKELSSINDIEEDLDIIDLCINPALGLKLLKECVIPFKCVVIQPGAESAEIKNHLEENNIPYIEGCLLVGISLYGKNKNLEE